MTTNAQKAQRIVGGVIDRLTTDKSGVPVATRITQALADAGLPMADLPEPSSDELVWYMDSSEVSKSFEVWISSTYGTVEVAGISSPQISLPADSAREMALSILAAINHAEQEHTDV